VAPLNVAVLCAHIPFRLLATAVRRRVNDARQTAVRRDPFWQAAAPVRDGGRDRPTAARPTFRTAPSAGSCTGMPPTSLTSGVGRVARLGSDTRPAGADGGAGTAALSRLAARSGEARARRRPTEYAGPMETASDGLPTRFGRASWVGVGCRTCAGPPTCGWAVTSP
jgi:hypothetical protein